MRRCLASITESVEATRQSKGELRGKLYQTGRGRLDDLAEQVAVEVAIHCGRPEKLCVVERVERFQPELQSLIAAAKSGFWRVYEDLVRK